MAYLPAVPEALATLRKGAASPAAIPTSAAAAQARSMGYTFAPSARVLDQVSQGQGVVVSSSIVHGVKPKPASAAAGSPLPLINLPAPTKTETVTVLLDTGTTVQRNPAWLVAIPAGLTVPLGELAK